MNGSTESKVNRCKDLREDNIYTLVNELSNTCDQRNMLHTNKAEKHEELLISIADTQKTIGDTQKCLSNSVSVLSNLIKRYEPHLMLVEKLAQTLSGIKLAIVWLAAIIGSMTVIVSASAVVWLYLTTSVQLEDFILK